MSRYDVDFRRMAVLLLPIALRKSITTTFVQVMVSPVSSLLRRFNQNRADWNYRMEHNGQVCYLQAVLNDKFDPLQRRIYIDDGEGADALLVYARSERRWQMVPRRSEGALILSSRAFVGQGAIDFIVFVPQSLSYDERRMKALVKMYKLAGKRFTIQTY